MNKRGGFTDFFLFMIVAFIIVVVMGVFIFVVTTVNSKLHEKMDNMTIGSGGGSNATQIIDNTIGKLRQSYYSFYWLSVFLIVGMIIAIFIGSYMVTTKPIFFIPYLFLVIIAIIVSVGISNGYELIINDATLSSTFANFVGANWIMLNLPIWITIIGFVGAIIMFARLGKGEQSYYGY